MKSRFFLSLLVLTVTVGVTSSLFQWHHQQRIYDDISHRMLNDYKVEVEHVFSNIEMKLEVMIHLLESKYGPTDNAIHLNELLLFYLDLIPMASAIYISDKEKMLGNAPIINRNKIYAHASRPWFIDPTENHQQIKYTNLYVDKFSQERIATLSKVIFNEPSHYAVIGIDIVPARLNVLFDKMQETIPTNVYVVDNVGAVVWGSKNALFDLSQTQLGEDGAYFDHQQHKKIYYSRLNHLNWTIIMAVDGDVLTSSLFKESLILFVVVGITLSLLCFFWWSLCEELKLFYFHVIRKLNDNNQSIDKFVDTTINDSHKAADLMASRVLLDELTGALNRRAFDKDLASALSDEGVTLLALIDIDNFKRINDTFGHQCGDDVLRAFAAMAKSYFDHIQVRSYRYGGEEFAILFRGISAVRAHALLDNFRHSFASRAWREGMPSITFSAGLKSWDGETLPEFLSAVDQLLYHAKQSGKNNINGSAITPSAQS